MSKFVYFFGKGKTDGNKDMRDTLGGKGANLAELANLGIDVPPGFTISTDVCRYYYKNNKSYPDGMKAEVEENLHKVEDVRGSKFGSSDNPLLISVRSGAAVSMPGMMDTVLNIGLNDSTVTGLVKKTNNERFVYDCYRRFVQMYGNVVLKVSHDEFEKILEEKKKERGAKLDTELSGDDMKEIVARYKRKVKEFTNKDFPDEPEEQLWGAISAVFESWDTERAISYRKLHKIPDDLGTALNVQAMVFGNTGKSSATGVAFTRNAATGEKQRYGEYLVNAQGEDVVAGIRTPHPIKDLERDMPDIYRQLVSIFDNVERHYKDVQDMEFTIENGKLWMLQTRTGKRTAQAAIKIAVDMVEEGLIDKATAVSRVDPTQLDQILHKMFDPKAKKEVIASGLNASPGAAAGKVVFTSNDAIALHERGEPAVLVRIETSPDDVAGMAVSEGILTARGGMTSHAAVVARGMGKCCVAGCGALDIDYGKEELRVGPRTIKKGKFLSLNGTTGEVMLGRVETIDSEITRVVKGEIKPDESEIYQYYNKLLSWADEIRKLGVRTNADTFHDAKLARDFGAEGIGLARTEHMFFGEERLPVVQKMILAKDEKERQEAIDKLLPMQREDFKGILLAMDGLPVIIRLLDPPLHEFLPKYEELLVEFAEARRQDDSAKAERIDGMLTSVRRLKEFNPMLGHRGCRLGVTFPAIYKMQVQAIAEASCELKLKGHNPKPEIMVPLVGHVNELKVIKEYSLEVMNKVMEEKGVKLDFMIGTMIELPRAAITADEIASEAEFFSYGTNDLTQMTFGFSRDDIEEKFLPVYIDKKILPANPFAVLDRTGVGKLVEMGIKKGRETKHNLEVGICGEHGGEPSSVEFCHIVNMDYVSCSPYRVPIARLSAAHAALHNKK